MGQSEQSRTADNKTILEYRGIRFVVEEVDGGWRKKSCESFTRVEIDVSGRMTHSG